MNNLSQYLRNNDIKPTLGKIDLFSFIKYIECYRLKENISIQKFCHKHKNDLKLYYFAAGAGLSQGIEVFLDELGIDKYKEIVDIVMENSIMIFDYIINNKLDIMLNKIDKAKLDNYFNTYLKYANDGTLDKAVKGDKL